MKIRKILSLAAIFCLSILITNSSSYAEGNTGTIIENLGTYTMSKYVYYPETDYDEMITDWMNRYDELVRSDSPYYFWNGTKQEALDIYYTFLTRFGYSENIALSMAKDQNDSDHYYLSFKPNSDIDTSVSSYISELNLTLNSASEVSAETNEKTVQNIYDYMVTHVSALYDTNGIDDLTPYMYNGLSGRKNLCEGFALIANRLCYINGIPSEILYGRYKGIAHGWNKVMINNKEYYFDAATNHDLSDHVLSDYEVYYSTPQKGKANIYIDYQ